MLRRFLLGAALVLMSTQSFAALISGQFDFVGAALLDRNGAGTAYISIDYIGSPTTIISTDDFATTIALNSPVTVTDPWVVSAPQANLWQAGGFSFDLSTITINNGTTVTGSGVITGNGFDATTGFWSFTSQSSGDGIFSFSSTTVPAPGIALLLGIGLVGIALTRKMRNA